MRHLISRLAAIGAFVLTALTATAASAVTPSGPPVPQRVEAAATAAPTPNLGPPLPLQNLKIALGSSGTPVTNQPWPSSRRAGDAGRGQVGSGCAVEPVVITAATTQPRPSNRCSPVTALRRRGGAPTTG